LEFLSYCPAERSAVVTLGPGVLRDLKLLMV